MATIRRGEDLAGDKVRDDNDLHCEEGLALVATLGSRVYPFGHGSSFGTQEQSVPFICGIWQSQRVYVIGRVGRQNGFLICSYVI